ncbi:MAG: patatin family protein [Ruminococcus sp.]|nr:patatin family protein [Ruminococcus sp.]
MKTGLVLEGGAMRGIYTAGVLDIFMEHGIHFDGVIGVSAGAIHGSSFVAGQQGRSIRYYKKYCGDKRFLSMWNLLRTGDVVDEQFCYHELPEKLDRFDYEAFQKADTEFYVTCSNVETGRAEYLRIRDMKKEVDLLRASASLPYASRIVTYEKKKLLDGGCCDSIPVKAFQRMGFEKNVVVLTQHQGYTKKPERRGLARMIYRKYPRFAQAVEERYHMYNREVQEAERLEREGEIFLIRPSEALEIDRMEHRPEELQRVYDIGKKDAMERIEALKQWL